MKRERKWRSENKQVGKRSEARVAAGCRRGRGWRDCEIDREQQEVGEEEEEEGEEEEEEGESTCWGRAREAKRWCERTEKEETELIHHILSTASSTGLKTSVLQRAPENRLWEVPSDNKHIELGGGCLFTVAGSEVGVDGVQTARDHPDSLLVPTQPRV
ncbi:unnamed protein product [Pleuronectes platessa]|uniref:Uncharacterized protein n=1 Tax=Pleuronectes platessa TaxID=8262 RepID=A0A9N7YJA9_PLEPL|nr:unnamed protein product [Pleuronectes platessa]